MPFPSHRKYAGRKEPRIRLTLRQNLRSRRLEVGMTQKALADRIGVATQWVQQIESPRGHEVPSVYQIEKLAHELGVTAADLFTPGRFKSPLVDADLRTRKRQ